MHFIVLRRLLAVAAAALCSACATTTAPTPQQMQALKAIDVVVMVPGRNFYFAPSDDDSTVLPGAVGSAVGSVFGSALATGAPSAAALGPGFALGLAAGLVNKGIEHVAAAPAREAAPIVGPTVDDIDLRRSVFAQLSALLPAETAAVLKLSDAPLPELVPGQTVEYSYARAAEQSSADATLYLAVVPMFRSPASSDPHTVAKAMLVARSGRFLMSTTVQFAGAKAPDGPAATRAQWWADGRYRRFVLYSMRAVLQPIAEAMAPTGEHAARAQRLRDKSHHLPAGSPQTRGLRTSSCALDSQQAQLVHRHEQLWSSLLIVAACEQDEAAIIRPIAPPALQNSARDLKGGGAVVETDERFDPDFTWLTRVDGATPTPVLRTAAR